MNVVFQVVNRCRKEIRQAGLDNGELCCVFLDVESSSLFNGS